MEQADFVHLVRLSEHASAENSRAYRRSVAAFAALGYAWVLGCLVLGAALVAWVVPQLLQGRWRLGLVLLLLTALALFWTSLRALWVRLDAPGGAEITAVEAPALFDALERIRRKIKGPHIHHVYLNDEFNACIQSAAALRPAGRRGQPPHHRSAAAHGAGPAALPGGAGARIRPPARRPWPLCRLDLPHPPGLDAPAPGLAGRHRSRGRGHAGVHATGTSRALRPRPLPWRGRTNTRPTASPGSLLGREVAAAALTEIEVRGAWLQTEFWARHWSKAADRPLPVGPYGSMRRRLARMPDAAFANDALRQALRRISSVDDTHPGLRDRIEALDTPPILPDWSRGGALDLLGSDAKEWLARFDKQWCRDHASEWKLHHAWLTRVRERVQVLSAGLAQNNANELVELARLKRHLDPRAVVRPLYELALERSAEHPGALRGLVQCLPEDDREARLQCLQRLWDADDAERWWTARAALAELETPRPGMEHDAAAFKQWRKRLERAQEAEDRAWEELSGSPFFSRVTRHDLSAFEQAELRPSWPATARGAGLAGAQAPARVSPAPGLPAVRGAARPGPMKTAGAVPPAGAQLHAGPGAGAGGGRIADAEELRADAAEPVFVR